jgi:DNA repair and recombination RAD54-like protein
VTRLRRGESGGRGRWSGSRFGAPSASPCGNTSTAPAVKKVVVVCPVSLVGNWDNEIKRWVGDNCITFPVKQDAKATIRNFINHRGKGVLIISYDQQRNNQAMFAPTSKFSKGASQCLCDLLICDEAHKLKNADSGIAKSLNLLPAKKRVLLSGTPMQNELEEFFNMVNFCNPGVLGTISEFKKRYERPILLSREPEVTKEEITKAAALQKELSTIVNEFILKRGNALNARHLPPKLVQYVCCRPTEEQEKMYDALIGIKNLKALVAGKQEETLSYIRYLIRLCCHPKLIYDTFFSTNARYVTVVLAATIVGEAAYTNS